MLGFAWAGRALPAIAVPASTSAAIPVRVSFFRHVVLRASLANWLASMRKGITFPCRCSSRLPWHTRSISPPAHAAVRPTIATNCTFGPFGHTYRAACTDGPGEEWDLALTCQSPSETKFIIYYGGIVEGSGTGYAECSLQGWTFYSWAIRNLS